MGGEQLGDAAAVGGRVDVEDARALERAASVADAVDARRRRRRRSRRVLLEQRDAFEHRATAAGPQGDVGIAANLSTMPVALAAPDKFRGTFSASEAAAAMAAACGPRGSTTSASSRSPTAARARSTRCSRRVAARAAASRVTGPLGEPVDAEWASPGRHRGGRDGAGEWTRAGPRPQRSAACDDTRGTGELIAAAVRGGASPRHRRRRRERDDRRRARRGRGTGLVARRRRR